MKPLNDIGLVKRISLLEKTTFIDWIKCSNFTFGSQKTKNINSSLFSCMYSNSRIKFDSYWKVFCDLFSVLFFLKKNFSVSYWEVLTKIYALSFNSNTYQVLHLLLILSYIMYLCCSFTWFPVPGLLFCERIFCTLTLHICKISMVNFWYKFSNLGANTVNHLLPRKVLQIKNVHTTRKKCRYSSTWTHPITIYKWILSYLCPWDIQRNSPVNLGSFWSHLARRKLQ